MRDNARRTDKSRNNAEASHQIHALMKTRLSMSEMLTKKKRSLCMKKGELSMSEMLTKKKRSLCIKKGEFRRSSLKMSHGTSPYAGP